MLYVQIVNVLITTYGSNFRTTLGSIISRRYRQLLWCR